MSMKRLVIELENRMRLIDLSVAEVCREADINDRTWRYWRSDQSKANVVKWNEIVAIVERHEAENK